MKLSVLKLKFCLIGKEIHWNQAPVNRREAAHCLQLNLVSSHCRRKPRESTDELAVIKAAAWAWYQHGSGSSEGKPVGEFSTTRTCRALQPSRYKLEAMKNAAKDAGKGSRTPSPNHTDNSLLDSYEIETISRQLDRLIGFSSNNFYSGTQKIASDSDEERKKKRSKKLRRIWVWQGVAVCGTGEDAVVAGALRKSQRPEELGAVAGHGG